MDLWTREQNAKRRDSSRLLQRVIRVVLAVDRSLPVYPDEQTFSVSDGMSQSGQRTKSLRDNPLRRAT
jgi:hypothetical protein